MLTIHERPFPLEDRAEAGHREGHLIRGKDQRLGVGTLVQRQAHLVRPLHLPARDSDHLRDARAARLQNLSARLPQSISWDQGTAMGRPLDIAKTLRTRLYFCDSRSPCQRGYNVSTIGELRQSFPNKSALAVRTSEHLRAVEDELYRRRRIVLNGRALTDVFNELLASLTSLVLQQ